MPDQIVSDHRAVDVLQDLATVCRDSQEGYRTAAGESANESLKAMFVDFADQRGREADELDRLIGTLGGQPVSRSGSLTGQAHRLFVSLRAAVTGNDRVAALREVARGESYAEAAFDRAMRMTLQGEARDVVQRLHDSVKASRDKIRRMAEAEGGTWEFPDAQRYLDDATRYVSEKPVTSSLVALGVGFVIGALTILMTRPTRGDGGHRHAGNRHRHPEEGPRANY